MAPAFYFIVTQNWLTNRKSLQWRGLDFIERDKLTKFASG